MLTIYGVPLSVHTRKVIIVAALKKIEHRVEPVIPFRPPANWAELSPTGLIPVIEHDGFRLADSTAISLYLDRIAPEPPLSPPDPKDAAYALFLDAYAGGALFRGLVHGLFFQRVIRPGMLGEATDESVVDKLLTDVRPKVLGFLEAEAARGAIGSSDLTLGEIALASNLINFHYLSYRLDGYPKLAAAFGAILARTEFRRALVAERPFAEQMGLAVDALEAAST